MSEARPLPRITVITPSLNQGPFLRQCIGSIIVQGYPNLEYIVIDGGSTDESLSVIREHASSIACWVSEKDSGQSEAINKGLHRASGELVAWLNADDYYLPGALNRIAEAYRKNPQAPFYFGDGVRVDESGREIGRFCPADRVMFDREALLLGLNYILQPATFINRKSLEKAGPLDTGLHYGMDTDLWMRLSALGEPCPIQAVLAATREYAATKTASGLFGRIEELRQIALRHSGAQMTPGVLCYFLDTLNRYAKEREDVFPPHFLTDLVAFWEKTARLLERYRAGGDGFPRDIAQSGPLMGAGLDPDRSMKIGVDLRQLILGASGGISQLLKGVFESLFALNPQHQFLVFCTPFNRSLLDCDARNVRFFSLPAPTFFTELDRIAREESLDILIRSYPMEDSLSFPLERQVVVIPDIQHEIYPEFFSAEALRARRIAFSRALGQAGAIGTISEFSKRTLRNFPGTRCRDIFLMPPSLQQSHKDAAGGLSESERALVPQGDYFLFPANLWKHKNHVRLLQAFKLLTERTRRNVTLVLTGHPDGWLELAGQFPDLPVRHLGFVRPELMRVLFERARALVFFSLYEGFGIPLLEAFDAGVPAICSNTTSLPEVGGDAVLTCDPTNVEAMAALMERILSNESLRGELIRRGKARLSAYSWEQSAHSLMQACVRVASVHRLPEAAPATAAGGPLPLVSIVTPSYNQGRFLGRTINSVLGQTYPHIEYVVVDGGSTDESLDVLRSFEDRVTWLSEPDRGQVSAINKGMARMQGEILAYLNSDDVLLPGAVARVVRFFREHPDCDMVYGDADYIDENDQVTGVYPTAEYSFLRLMEDCMVCQPAAFWRRRIADKVGTFNEQLNYAMDYDYWQRIDRAGGIIRFLPERLACSRRYPETKTLSARAAIYKEIFRVCKINAGYARQSFFTGYWHHLAHERDTPASRILRQFPDLTRRLSWLHHKWYNRDRYTRQDVARFFYGWVKIRVLRVGRWIAGTYSAIVRGGHTGTSVSGYMTDNWLGPTVAVPPRRRAPGQTLHLAGITPIDTVMTIRSGKVLVGRFPFAANQHRKVSFSSDSIGSGRITIQFSDYFIDVAKRRLSLRLQDTNIFAKATGRGA